MATAGELGGVRVRRGGKREKQPSCSAIGWPFSVPFSLSSFCSSFFLPNSGLLAGPSMFEMLEAGLSHELKLGVSAGLSFLPVCGCWGL